MVEWKPSPPGGKSFYFELKRAREESEGGGTFCLGKSRGSIRRKLVKGTIQVFSGYFLEG